MPAGIQDIDELVAAFNTAEDANYTLFNYVNEVNTEVETLEDNIAKVRKEIEEYVTQVRVLVGVGRLSVSHHGGSGALFKAASRI